MNVSSPQKNHECSPSSVGNVRCTPQSEHERSKLAEVPNIDTGGTPFTNTSKSQQPVARKYYPSPSMQNRMISQSPFKSKQTGMLT